MRRCNGTALESDLSLTLVVQSEKRFLFKFCKTLQNFILVAQATHIPCFNIVTNSLCTDDAKLERHILIRLGTSFAVFSRKEAVYVGPHWYPIAYTDNTSFFVLKNSFNSLKSAKQSHETGYIFGKLSMFVCIW